MKRRRGLTMIEVLISVAILAVVLGFIYQILFASQKLYVSGSAKGSLQERARTVTSQFFEEIRRADFSYVGNPTLVGTGGDQSLAFQIITGFDSGTNTPIVHPTPVIYSSELEEGEIDDGLDNNGDGIVDERVITRTFTHPGNDMLIGTADDRVDTARMAHGLKEGTMLINKDASGIVQLRFTLTMKDPERMKPSDPPLEVPISITVKVRIVP